MKQKLVHLFSVLTTALFCLLPVRRRVFVYTIRSTDCLRENLQCVYAALHCKKKKKKKMLPHGKKDILRARYYLLTSRVILTDDYIRYLRDVKLHPQQKVIQIWHAVGAFKRFGLDAPSRLTPEDERRTHAAYTTVCVSAEAVRPFYASAFGIGIEKVQPLGVPRTDVLLDKAAMQQKRDTFFKANPALQNKTCYVYLPTFRETNGTVRPFDPQLPFDAISRALQPDEVLLIGRHPVMQTPFFPPDTYKNILDLSGTETTLLLSAAAVVITDYSSVVFDAALLVKPLLFYCPDLDDYERTFYLDYQTDLPGEICRDGNAFLPLVRQAKQTANNEKIRQFCKIEAGACDGHSTERIVRLIEAAVSDA